MFATKLKELMKEKNMAAGTLADIVGVNPQTFMSWLDGSKEPYPAIRPALCKALECTEAVLFGSEKSEPQTKTDPAPETKKPKTTSKPKEIVVPMPKPIEEKKPEETLKPAVSVAPAAPEAPAPVVKEQPKIAPVQAQPHADAVPTLFSISRELSPLPKPIAKNADSAVQAKWAEDLAKSISDNVAKIAQMAATQGIPDRYKKLLEAAQGASDDALELAISVLKKCK